LLSHVRQEYYSWIQQRSKFGYAQPGYPPQQPGYPPAPGQPPFGGYGAYPPYPGYYPPQPGYPPQQPGYPPQQPGYPPAASGYPPAPGNAAFMYQYQNYPYAYPEAQPEIQTQQPHPVQKLSAVDESDMATEDDQVAPSHVEPPAKRTFQEFPNKKKEDPVGPKLPAEDDFAAFYSELEAEIKPAKPTSASPQATSPTMTASNPQTASKHVTRTSSSEAVSKTSIQKQEPTKPVVRVSTMKLVDYDEETDAQNAKKPSGGLPFWAAPNPLDDADANPLKQREKARRKMDDLESSVYSELGLK